METSRSQALSDRFVRFGVAVASAVRSMPRDVSARNVARQLTRCGTSPAANYAEARESVSARDYAFKMQVCLKELRETAVWIRIARGAGYRNADYAALEQECGELTAIVVTCVKKVKASFERPLTRIEETRAM